MGHPQDAHNTEDRIFVRVPVRTYGRIYIDDKPVKKVKIKNISTGGISFLTDTVDDLPMFFELRFRIGRSKKEIRAGVQVRNRTAAGPYLRVGCKFFKPQKEVMDAVHKYIIRFLDCSTFWGVADLAAIIIIADSMWRVLVELVGYYYGGTVFGGGIFEYAPGIRVLFLGGYLAAGYGLLLVPRALNIRGHIVKVVFLFAAAVFLTLKVTRYSYLKLFVPDMNIPYAFIWIELFFLFYVCAAAFSGWSMTGKVRLISQVMRIHEKGVSKRGAGPHGSWRQATIS